MDAISDNSGQTELMLAATQGNASQVNSLIENNEAFDARDAKGATALMHAAYAGHAAIVKILASRGADIQIQDRMGWSPLRHAAHNGHAAVARFLIDRGADVDAKDIFQKTPLMYSAINGHLEIVEMLIGAGAKIDAMNKIRRTALMYAAEENHAAICEALLKKGANVNAKDEMRWTALRYAARKGAFEAVQVLIQNKADLNAKDASGKTPLMGAARKGYEEVVQLLLKSGAGGDLRTVVGRTALMFAAFEGHQSVIDLLLKSGAEIDAQDEWGWTALVYAYFGRKWEAADFLRSRGAKLLKDKSGRDFEEIEKLCREEIIRSNSNHSNVLFYYEFIKDKTLLTIQSQISDNSECHPDLAEREKDPFQKKEAEGFFAPLRMTKSKQSHGESKSCITVLTYNRENVLKIALQGLKKHCKAPVAVFEDYGFKDETRKLLAQGKCMSRPDLEAEQFDGPDFTAFLGTANLGVAGNTNRALKWFMESDCDHLLLCNDDFEVLGDFASFYAKAHRELGMGLFCFCDHEEPEYQPKVIPRNGYTLHLLPRPTGLVISVTREVIEKIGYFDVRYGRYGQEHVSFNYRAGLAGFLTVDGEMQASIDVKLPQVLLKNQNVFTAIEHAEIDEAYLLPFVHASKIKKRCEIEGVYQPFRLRRGSSANKYVVPVSFWDYVEQFQI
jgi:uncharacterized protein